MARRTSHMSKGFAGLVHSAERIQELEAEVTALKAQVRRLAETLDVYALEENWTASHSESIEIPRWRYGEHCEVKDIEIEFSEPVLFVLDEPGYRRAQQALAGTPRVLWSGVGGSYYDGCIISLPGGTELILGPEETWEVVDGPLYRVTITEAGGRDERETVGL